MSIVFTVRSRCQSCQFRRKVYHEIGSCKQDILKCTQFVLGGLHHIRFREGLCRPKDSDCLTKLLGNFYNSNFTIRDEQDIHLWHAKHTKWLDEFSRYFMWVYRRAKQDVLTTLDDSSSSLLSTSLMHSRTTCNALQLFSTWCWWLISIISNSLKVHRVFSNDGWCNTSRKRRTSLHCCLPYEHGRK